MDELAEKVRWDLTAASSAAVVDSTTWITTKSFTFRAL
jgi:hypothetical protein